MKSSGLVFLKLGGSLITDKNQKSIAKHDVINRIAKEIQQVIVDYPTLQLIIGHGSGSFGHQAAKKYSTREGVISPEDWLGFTEVWKQANKLNRIVVDALLNAGLSVMSFPPSSSAVTKDGKLSSWNLQSIQASLANQIIPVVQGDVVIDSSIGGTIVSTEEVFAHLALNFLPKRILLAGIEKGVWHDYPVCSQLVKEINNDNFREVSKILSGSISLDVTGGMQSKVQEMLTLVNQLENSEIEIFSGIEDNSIYKVLTGIKLGTIIR